MRDGLQAALADDLGDPVLELGGTQEFPAQLFSALEATVQLADPIVEALQVPASPQEGIIQVSHIVAVAAAAVQVLPAAQELGGNAVHFIVDLSLIHI